MEKRTLNLDGTIVYCYADGSVEWLSKHGNRFTKTGLHRTFGSVDRKGYMLVKINKKIYKIHRLICMAFHSNPNSLPEVDHVNRDRKDNTPENLRWVSSKENQDNKASVDKALERYGIRSCDDKKAYDRQHNKYCLKMIKPDGSQTTSGALSQEIYDLLKPLSQKERFLKYKEILNG